MTKGPDHTRRIAFALIAVVAVVMCIGSFPRSVGETLNSRLATCVALVHYGTWFIDRPPDEAPNPFEQRTIDKVRVDGRLLSSKPPVLSLLMAAEYMGLHRVFGLSLLNGSDLRPVVYILTLTFVGIPFLVMLVCFWMLLELLYPGRGAPLTPFVVMAFCTPLSGYGFVFNNHVPAAALIGVSLFLGARLTNVRGRPRIGVAVLLGLSMGLVPVLDMPAGFFSLAGAAYLCTLRIPRRALAAVALAGAIPVATHFALALATTGSLVPLQLRADAFLYESSYWRNPAGMDALNNPRFNYLFHITLGRKGLFSLYPVLLAGVLLPARAFARRDIPRLPVLLALFAFAIMVAFYVARTNNYGGEAYGFRWFIPAVPVLVLLAAVSPPPRITRPLGAVAILLIALSSVSAWQCTRHPWKSDREWTVRLFGPSF